MLKKGHDLYSFSLHFINHEAREIMYLEASVPPSNPSACLSMLSQLNYLTLTLIFGMVDLDLG